MTLDGGTTPTSGRVGVTVTCVTHRGRVVRSMRTATESSGYRRRCRTGGSKRCPSTRVRTSVVVADGLGGHPAGDVASDVVVRTVLSAAPIDAQGLVAAVRRADVELGAAVAGNPSYEGMDSTVAAVMLLGSRLVVANVGDSEVLAVGNDGLVPLTVLDVPLDKRHFRSSTTTALTQHLGTRQAPGVLDVHQYVADYRPGVRLLVCTDGLTDVVPLAEIDDILRHRGGVPAVRALLDEALQVGAPDNVTLVLVEVDGGPQVRRGARR